MLWVEAYLLKVSGRLFLLVGCVVGCFVGGGCTGVVGFGSGVFGVGVLVILGFFVWGMWLWFRRWSFEAVGQWFSWVVFF